MECNNCGAEKTESHCDYCGSGVKKSVYTNGGKIHKNGGNTSGNINSSYYTSKRIERFILFVVTLYAITLYIYSII
jgi:hypothetical protein